uniref:Uncharacterized protein n=1 Tax=Lotharella oceanica TaxID=641309 RepID=A0A7S2X8V5_9EUKA|mmetsp:Transcript_18677/g.35258  ORF Transcript_18677/g.35258 Transcript_18677/m.35258 type:complete len:152 (+) Transcript_18677:446-901(+)
MFVWCIQKIKFDAKKTAFSAQRVRKYTKTNYTAGGLKLTEKQRMEVMAMVKGGECMVDEAMEAVLKHDKNVREALADKQDVDMKEGRKLNFTAHYKAADMSKLSAEQRMQVMNLVKDKKISVEQAMKEVLKGKELKFDERPELTARCCAIV